MRGLESEVQSIPAYIALCQKPTVTSSIFSTGCNVLDRRGSSIVVFHMAIIARYIGHACHVCVRILIRPSFLLACTQPYVCQFPMIIKSACFPFGYQYIASVSICIGDSPYNVIHMESGWPPFIFFTCMQINSCSQLPLILTSRDLGHHASLKIF